MTNDAAIPSAIDPSEFITLRFRMSLFAFNVWERAVQAMDSVRLLELECWHSELFELVGLLVSIVHAFCFATVLTSSS